MGSLHQRSIGAELPGRYPARGSVLGGIALPCRRDAKPLKHAQPIGIWCQQWLASAEQENLLGARFADSREVPQCPLRLGDRECGDRVEVAIEIVERNPSALAELLGKPIRQDS